MKSCPPTFAHRYAPGWAGVASVAACLLTAAGAGAQMHKVEAPQKVTRAVGVYEWTGDLKKPDAARLVPVTLFINGRFEDAGVYLARPEPFALQTGIAYEVDQAGKPLGTLNLDYARDVVTRRSATDDNPISSWYGYGTLVLPTVAPKPNLKPSARLPVITSSGHDTGTASDDDGKPHLARRAGSESDSTGAAPGTSSTPAATTTTNPTPPNPAPAADSDRPTLSRRQDSTSNAPASSTPTPTVGADDSDRPTLRHRDPADNTKPKKQEEGGAVIPLNTSLNDDPNRPMLHRGKPLGEISVAPLAGVPASLHQAVAVSDAGAHEEHVFQREWASDSERAQTLAELETLARARIQSYITTNKLALTDPDAKPAAPAPAPARSSRTRAAKPAAAPDVSLANEELNGYELTYGGLATFVYTVETPLYTGGPVYLTMVAQRLPGGNLQVALSSMTDASHLDRTPWFRLVDAVDPDGSHRASLLFELRAQSTRQFALYRLITANAEQSFLSGIIE